jgi:murein L,D-transpeptidase YcbB/YkuD
METFKAYILILGFIGALGFGGYWAATSFTEPVRVVDTNNLNVVAQAPSDSFFLDSDLNTTTNNDETNQNINVSQNENILEPVVAENPSSVSSGTTTSSNSQHTALIQGLQRLIDDVVIMREGSRGTRVGVVQNFLNIYNNTSNRVDNDYGPGTKNRVQQFQRDQGLNADGQTGPETYRKMIEWLAGN